MNDAEDLAIKFHEAYERLAPQFGYATRESSAVPWSCVPEMNKRLMIAVCAEILEELDVARRVARECAVIAYEADTNFDAEQEILTRFGIA